MTYAHTIIEIRNCVYMSRKCIANNMMDNSGD